MEIEVPRDTGAPFDPQMVTKRQRRLAGVDGIVLLLSAKDLTTSEMTAEFGEVLGARVFRDTISRITEKVAKPAALKGLYPTIRAPPHPVGVGLAGPYAGRMTVPLPWTDRNLSLLIRSSMQG